MNPYIQRGGYGRKGKWWRHELPKSNKQLKFLDVHTNFESITDKVPKEVVDFKQLSKEAFKLMAVAS